MGTTKTGKHILSYLLYLHRAKDYEVVSRSIKLVTKSESNIFIFSLIDGSAKYDGYTFYNWAGIDIFCYFSHHLITIPPVAWINTGHAHGVKVIGMYII